MKAESAAAGKRSRDKKMLAAAIKIQVIGRLFRTPPVNARTGAFPS